MKRIILDVVGDLKPDKILFMYDCVPMSFTSFLPNGSIVYCHFFDFMNKGTRYFVSKINNEMLKALCNCELSVRDAIKHDLNFFVDFDDEMKPYRAFRVADYDIDEDSLPQQGVMIFPQNVANAPNT